MGWITYVIAAVIGVIFIGIIAKGIGFRLCILRPCQNGHGSFPGDGCRRFCIDLAILSAAGQIAQIISRFHGVQ